MHRVKYLRLNGIQSGGSHLPQSVPPVLGQHPEVMQRAAVDCDILAIEFKTSWGCFQSSEDATRRVILVEGG
jgi:hypothetical protein